MSLDLYRRLFTKLIVNFKMQPKIFVTWVLCALLTLSGCETASHMANRCASDIENARAAAIREIGNEYDQKKVASALIVTGTCVAVSWLFSFGLLSGICSAGPLVGQTIVKTEVDPELLKQKTKEKTNSDCRKFVY